MSEETPEQKIARLKQELKEAKAKTAEAPKEEVPKEDPPKDSKPPKEEEKKEEKLKIDPPIEVKFVPPDPLADVTGISIEWIDHRYHIHGIRGMSKNTLIIRNLSEIDNLIFNLEYAKAHFNQEKMVSTKKPRIVPKKTCIYLSEEIRGKCTNEHYFDGIKKQYTTKDRTCLFTNQDRCPQAD